MTLIYRAVSSERLRSLIALLSGAFAIYFALNATWEQLLTVEYRVAAIAVVAVLVVAWLVVRSRRHWTWTRTSLDKALDLWIVAFGVSLLANLDTWRRISIGLWFVGLYILFWYLLHDGIGNKRLSREILVDGLLLAGAGVLLSGYAEVWQWVASGSVDTLRVRSILENANTLATVLLIVLPLAVARLLTVRGWSMKIILSVYSLLAACLLFLTYTRGAWLAAGVSVALLGALLIVHYGLAQRQYRLVVPLAVVALSVVGVSVTRGWSAADRIPIYNAAIQMFTEKPISGYGLFTFGRGLLRIVGVVPGTTAHAHAHNVFLNVAAELGVIGLVALVATLVVLFLALRRNWLSSSGHERILFAGVAAAIAGFGIHHLFDMTALLPAVALPGLVVLVIGVAPVTPIPAPPSRVRPLLVYALTGVLLLTAVWDTAIYSVYVAGVTDAIIGKVDEAAQEIQAASDADPAMPVYQLHRAFILDVIGHYQAAVDAARTFCRQEPNYPVAPYDGEAARLQFYRLSLVIPAQFRFLYSCQGSYIGP